MLRSSRLVASRRFLSDGSAHLGVLHVYRLSLAERPPGKQLKLLFPSGAPKSDHDSAAQLAMAAERGDPVLVPERALRHILDGGGTQLQLDASAPTPTPSLPLPSTDSAAGEGGSSAAVLASGPGSGSTELALAFAERAVPLADALAGGAADGTQPDWARTVALPHDDSTNHGAPTEAQNAVLAAAVSGDSSALAKALSECPPADLATATLPPSGATPLHLAAASGALRAVRLLLDTGVNVNASATNGSTALHWAAGGGHTEIVRALLSAGASPRARSSTWGSTVRGNDSGQTAAHWAAASGEPRGPTLGLSLSLGVAPTLARARAQPNLTIDRAEASSL